MSNSKIILPNLYIAGAAKSGTTTLHDYLKEHPDIVMPAVKEPHFLCRQDRGVEHYAKLYDDRLGHYRGDSSSGYLLLPEVAE